MNSWTKPKLSSVPQQQQRYQQLSQSLYNAKLQYPRPATRRIKVTAKPSYSTNIQSYTTSKPIYPSSGAVNQRPYSTPNAMYSSSTNRPFVSKPMYSSKPR